METRTMNDEGETFLTAAEAGRLRAKHDLRGVDPETILRWEETGLLKRAATVKGKPVFRADDVLAVDPPQPGRKPNPPPAPAVDDDKPTTTDPQT